MKRGLYHLPVLGLADAPHAKEILSAGKNLSSNKSIMVDEFNKSRKSRCL